MSTRESCACRLQIFCYALSPPDGSEWRARIEAEVEHFTDVSAWPIPDIAARLSADQIQVGFDDRPLCMWHFSKRVDLVQIVV